MARPKKNSVEPVKHDAAADKLIEYYDQTLASEYKRVTRTCSYFGLLSLGIQTPLADKELHRYLVQQAQFNSDIDVRIEFEHALIAHGYQTLNK